MRIYQPWAGGFNSLLSPHYEDLFIKLDNGGTIKISLHADHLEVMEGNGTSIHPTVINGFPGVRIDARKES